MPIPQGIDETEVNPTNWNVFVDTINELAAGVAPDGVATFGDGDATPSVANNSKYKTDATGTTTITGFTNGVDGQEIVIIAVSTTTFTPGANLKLNSGSSRVIVQYDIISFILTGTVWCESGYQENTAL